MTLRLAAVQFAPAHGNVDHNVQRMAEAIASTQAHIVVFPELATSGYFFVEPAALRPYAMPLSHNRMDALRAASDATGRTVVVGFAELDGDVMYNSAAILLPGSKPVVYRKTHLFYKERLVFAPGNSGFVVVDVPGHDCKLGVMICYDWRFPESARCLALQGADVIACPSNLVTHIWRKVMPARAVENKVYLAVANRTGSETTDGETTAFNGDSVLYAPNGDVLASADATSDAVVASDIEPASTRDKSLNPYNDIFADRRPEMYGRILVTA
jgi:predicted amidohydrolase